MLATRKAYRQLALKEHPDKSDDEDAKNKFQAIGDLGYQIHLHLCAPSVLKVHAGAPNHA